jgi:hypothetical protein
LVSINSHPDNIYVLEKNNCYFKRQTSPTFAKSTGNCFYDVTQLTDISNVANCERRLRNYIFLNMIFLSMSDDYFRNVAHVIFVL